MCGQSRAEKRWDRANSGENQGVRLMGGSQKSHIPSAAPLSPRGCDSWLDKPQRRTLLNKCYDHLRWEKLFIKTENELLLVWFQGQLFLILSFCIFLQELQRSCIYNREGEKIQREDTYVFPIFSLSFVFVVFTMWDGLGEHCLLLERKTKKLVRQNWQSYLRWIPDFSFF